MVPGVHNTIRSKGCKLAAGTTTAVIWIPNGRTENKTPLWDAKTWCRRYFQHFWKQEDKPCQWSSYVIGFVRIVRHNYNLELKFSWYTQVYGFIFIFKHGFPRFITIFTANKYNTRHFIFRHFPFLPACRIYSLTMSNVKQTCLCPPSNTSSIHIINCKWLNRYFLIFVSSFTNRHNSSELEPNQFTAYEFPCIFLPPQSTRPKNWSNCKQCVAYTLQHISLAKKLSVASRARKSTHTFHLDAEQCTLQ